MKQLTLGLLILTSTPSLWAGSTVQTLNGRSYCRTVVSDGMFGQPRGQRQHCVKFENGFAIDNVNTFFGSPPEAVIYEIVDGKVVFGDSSYQISTDGTSLTSVTADVELVLQK